MTCFICEGAAQSIDSGGDYHWRVCAECGEYKISRTAVDSLGVNGWKLDIQRTRNWLAFQQGSGEIPLITWQVAAVMIRS